MACGHEKIVATEHESICSICGIVLDDVSLETSVPPTNSKANLYELRSIGSREELPKTKECEPLRAYFHGSISDEKSRKQARLLSKFSNTCDKLNLIESQREYAWQKFVKALPGKSARKIGETACWAIYESCKAHEIPLEIAEIAQAVKTNFRRKKLQNIISILYENIDSASDRAAHHDERYYFKLNLKKLVNGREVDPARIAEIEKRGWHLYNRVYTVGNCNMRARKAISRAMGMRV